MESSSDSVQSLDFDALGSASPLLQPENPRVPGLRHGPASSLATWRRLRLPDDYELDVMVEEDPVR